jgi:hypothetical protein
MTGRLLLITGAGTIEEFIEIVKFSSYVAAQSFTLIQIS